MNTIQSVHYIFSFWIWSLAISYDCFLNLELINICICCSFVQIRLLGQPSLLSWKIIYIGLKTYQWQCTLRVYLEMNPHNLLYTETFQSACELIRTNSRAMSVTILLWSMITSNCKKAFEHLESVTSPGLLLNHHLELFFFLFCQFFSFGLNNHLGIENFHFMYFVL